MESVFIWTEIAISLRHDVEARKGCLSLFLAYCQDFFSVYVNMVALAFLDVFSFQQAGGYGRTTGFSGTGLLTLPVAAIFFVSFSLYYYLLIKKISNFRVMLLLT